MEIRIKELCQERGITQKTLAQNLGVSEKTLSFVAKGNTSLQLLERIAQELDVQLPELFKKEAPGLVCPHCGKPIKIALSV